MTLDESVDENAPVCRICRDGSESGALETFCNCKGSVGSFHHNCLVTWLKQKTSDDRICEICSFSYVVGQETKPISQWEWQPSRKIILSMVTLVGLIVLCVVGFVAFTYVWPMIEEEVLKEDQQHQQFVDGELHGTGVNYGFVPAIPADMRVAVIFLQAGLFLVLVVSLVRLCEKCKPLAQHLRDVNTIMVLAPNNQTETAIVIKIDSNTGSQTSLETDTASQNRSDVTSSWQDAHTFLPIPEGRDQEVTSSPRSPIIGQLETSKLLLPNQAIEPRQYLIVLRESVL